MTVHKFCWLVLFLFPIYENKHVNLLLRMKLLKIEMEVYAITGFRALKNLRNKTLYFYWFLGCWTMFLDDIADVVKIYEMKRHFCYYRHTLLFIVIEIRNLYLKYTADDLLVIIGVFKNNKLFFPFWVS